jgi:hypothetical protein
MADLFMRLIRESQASGEINVLNFLFEEASKIGFTLQVSNSSKDDARIIAFPRKLRSASLDEKAETSLSLAADTDSAEESVVLMTEQENRIARAFHSFRDGTLKFDFRWSVPFKNFDAEIHFYDGSTARAEDLQVKEHEAVTVCRCQHTEDAIERVVFTVRA